EIFFNLENFGPLQVTKLRRPAINARGDDGERAQKFGVAIALDDLGGKGGRFDPEPFANFSFNFWIDMGMGADGAANFADADPFPSLAKPFFGAPELVEHERE